jgi:Tol biopolymer transport system component
VAEDGDGHPQIFVMNTRGNDLHQLTHEPIAAVSPAWSPDGARIAFRGLTRDSMHAIYVVDVASGESTRITRGTADVTQVPSWLPDDRTVVFQVGAPPVIRSVDLATGETSTIVKDAGLPDVSPDGSRLAFNTWSMAKVTLIDIDGSDRTIIRTGSEMYNAKWSPNGERIAFQSYPGKQVSVYQVGTEERRLTGVSGDIVEWLDDQTLLVLM